MELRARTGPYACVREIPVLGQNRDRVIVCSMIFLALYIMLTFATGLFAAQEKAISDEAVTAAVENNLLIDPGVSPHLIDVATTDGVVTLSGTVSSLLEKDRALTVTRMVKGVRSIVDRLEIRAAHRPDGEIEQDVTQALLTNPATESYEVTVRVKDAVVTLQGTVESWAEKLLAEKVAKGVRGVKAVKNGISYDYESDRPASEIETDIEGRLRADPYIDHRLIDVEVNDGVVTLTGAVGSLAEKSYAESDARVAGVSRIDTRQLKVKWWARDAMTRKTKLRPMTDEQIKEAVKDALLYDPRAAAFEVGVEVEDGEVTLRGIVDNLKAKKAAERDAQHTAGVWKVENRIKVRPADVATDSEIADNIRTALSRDPIVERFEITVMVRNRKAYLSGAVDSLYEKRRAEDVASQVVGVVSVVNNIRPTRRWTWKSDQEVKTDVKDEWFWSPFVDGEDLTVRVQQGHVTIAGAVEDWSEMLAAVDNAFESGAKSVETYIRVQENDRIYERYWGEPPADDWLF